ncbi:MAG TPA: GNAT family N-acetyltransferase [Paracoccaceae bacterium]|nr:GNAT family N-acetyltransferase [Paracoccaceae bacterium]
MVRSGRAGGPPRGLSIRPSAEDDLAMIQAIYAHHVLHGLASFEEEPPSLAEIAARRRAILARGLPHLVAAAAGRVLGYAYAGPYRPRPAYRFTLEDSIYLAPEMTGRGIGGRLLAELIERATALGYRQMIAVIGDSAHRPSILLHERAGFAHVGVLRAVGFKFGRWVDTVLMQRALGPGASAPSEGRGADLG